MKTINEITNEQALNAIQVGEFSSDIIRSNEIVVVVLTQDWCPQWLNMSQWLKNTTEGKNVDIYSFIYNKADCFHEFMKFKESKWNNYEIPYLRFYSNGKLIKDANYMGQKDFKDILSNFQTTI